MSFSAKRKFIITVFFSGAAVLASGGLYVYLARGIENFDFSLRELESNIATLENNRSYAQLQKRILEERTSDVQRIEAFFVKKDDPVEFIEGLEDLARSTRNAMALDVNRPGQANGVFSFRLTLEGTEKSILKYLEALEFMPYEILVEEMAFQKLEAPSAAALRGVTVTSRLVISITTKSRL